MSSSEFAIQFSYPVTFSSRAVSGRVKIGYCKVYPVNCFTKNCAKRYRSPGTQKNVKMSFYETRTADRRDVIERLLRVSKLLSESNLFIGQNCQNLSPTMATPE